MFNSKRPEAGDGHAPPAATPVTAEYLASVTIGQREPHNDRIRLVPYDVGWPELFALAADTVRAALSEKALLIEHVGSTAVYDLSAKPIIDMVLAVEDSAAEAAYVPLLEAVGFALIIREPDWFEHRLLRLKSDQQVWQLHVFSAGCEEIDRMMSFRDWLRAHESERLLSSRPRWNSPLVCGSTCRTMPTQSLTSFVRYWSALGRVPPNNRLPNLSSRTSDDTRQRERSGNLVRSARWFRRRRCWRM